MEVFLDICLCKTFFSVLRLIIMMNDDNVNDDDDDV